jgi:hypothetical protein
MHALQRIDPKYGSAVQCVRHVSLGAAAGAAVCRRARATAPAPFQDAAARCRCRASTTSATATISSSSTTTTTTSSSTDHNRRAALGGLVSAAAALAVGLPAPRPAAAAEGDACTPTTAPSGLIWCDLQQGDGPTPLRGAFYKAHYRASLGSNATEFDSSYAKKTPMIFKVRHDAAKVFEQQHPPSFWAMSLRPPRKSRPRPHHHHPRRSASAR